MRKQDGERALGPVIAVAVSCPVGVGPELCLRAIPEPKIIEHCIPVVFGDVGVPAVGLRHGLSAEVQIELDLVSDGDLIIRTVRK